jgi:transcriptional regulator with XRE-family HTH domain
MNLLGRFEPLTPEQIRACRFELEKTQEEMSNLVGVTVTTWARWERGEEKPGHPKMLRLALERLLLDKEEKPLSSRLESESNKIEGMLAMSEEMTANRRQRIRRMPEAHAAVELMASYSEKTKV